MLRVWLVAIVLAAVSVAALLAVPRSWMIYGYGIPQTQVVLIGSSLFANGMPPTGTGLFGDDRTYARVAVGGITEDMVIEFAELVIAADHAKVIVLEIYPFMRVFASDNDGLATRSLLARTFANVQLVGARVKTRIAIALGFLTGIQTANVVLGEVADTPAQPIRDVDLKERFPMLLRKPLNPSSIRDIVSDAHAKGIEVYLIAPPRRQAVVDYIGTDEAVRLEQHVRNTAAEMALPLLYDGGTWPDSLFVDVSHLNRAGRARFMSELARAWKAAHDG